ncbi:MAG: GtrA family protein [Candidatus Sungbacteria bacterium]|nr:GtrA family protein [Candidatus Sungbacteria bacterium]
MLSTIDYLVAVLIGFFAGIFLIPTLLNLGVRDKVLLLALPWALAGVYALGIKTAAFLARRFGFITQFSKFVAVGVLNTAIDFGVLNLLSAATGVTSGFVVGGVNVPGFAAAVSNSYALNKFWVFQDRRGGLFEDAPKFLLVTGASAVLNSGVVVLVTTYGSSFLPLPPHVLLNVAKASAVILNLAWNFFGYKFFVFRSALPRK